MAARGFNSFVAELDALLTVGEQSPGHRMQAMARAYLRFASAHPAIYGSCLASAKCVLIRHRTSPRPCSPLGPSWKGRCASGGDHKRATHAAVTVWSTVHGLALLRIDHKLPPHIDPELALENVTRTLIAGLEAEA